MMIVFPKLRKTLLLEAVMGVVLIHLTLQGKEAISDPEIGFFSSQKKPKTVNNLSESSVTGVNLKKLEQQKETYTINFTNISIIEYIRFASKITNLNFVFHDEELQFAVTIISEDPVTPQNLISILIQVLRINGLVVLEQDNNLLITKVRNVSQLATIVDSDLEKTAENSPIVTRVFRIKNANLLTVSNVIKPMLSDSALLEASPETQQLIVTDLTTNIDKIATLLSSIDTPHTTLEIDSYVARYLPLDHLIKLSTQIITPFINTANFTLVPEYDSNTIFIISTPFLIEKALNILEDLDLSKTEFSKQAGNNQTAFLYQSLYKPSLEFASILDKVSKELEDLGASQKLVDCLKNSKVIKESNSILFLSDEETLSKLKELLQKLDTNQLDNSFLGEKADVYIYKIQHGTEDHIQNSLDILAEDLQKSPYPDYHLIETIESCKYLPDSHALLFTGTVNALKKIQELVPNFDVVPTASIETDFFVYYPQHRNGEDLLESIHDLSSNLKVSRLTDPYFLTTLESVKWNPANRSLIFTGKPEVLEKIKGLLNGIDNLKDGQGEEAHTFFLYKLKQAKGPSIIENLKKISGNLNDAKLGNTVLIQTLTSIEWIKENNSLLIKGPSYAVEQARTLIEQFDISANDHSILSPKSSFFIYKASHQKAKSIASSLKDLATDLESSGLSDQNLLSTIDHAKYVEATDSILFTGDTETLEKIKPLLEKIDTLNPQESQIQQLGKTTFLLYKIQYVSGSQLISSVKGFIAELQKNGATTPQVIQSAENLKWIQPTNSILVTGSKDAIAEIENVLKKFDLESLGTHTKDVNLKTTFVVYTPKYQTGETLINTLTEFYKHLSSAGIINKNLLETISNLKWMPQTSSLIISGDEESVQKIVELLIRFDVSTADAAKGNSIDSIQDSSFLIYKLQYHQGGEILTALKQIGTDLGSAKSTKNESLLSAINSLQWIQVTNSLLASGDSETLTKLRSLVQNLDIPLRQVFIEVLVIETNVNNTQNFGLQWGGKMQYLNKFAAGVGNFPVPNANSTGSSINSSTTPTSIQPGINATNAKSFPQSSAIPFLNGFDLGVIGDIIMHKGKSFISLGNLVNSLQADTDSTIIMNPKLITQDNRTSTIFVGNNIPFIGSLVTTSANIVSSSSNIEYRDIGFNLTITPTIGNNDVVTLDIINDITEVTSSPTIGATNASNQQSTITGIQTSHTSMTTRVHVPNEHFVVLSGMLTDTKARFKSGVPCLGVFPLLGAFFSENDRVASKQNVIIFLRPHIVDTYEEYKAITDQQHILFKDSLISPTLQEEFDKGIDLIKDVENE